MRDRSVSDKGFQPVPETLQWSDLLMQRFRLLNRSHGLEALVTDGAVSYPCSFVSIRG